MRPRPAIGIALAFLATFAVEAHAADPVATRARCTAAYEQAQELRSEERLQAARAQLLICGASCPATFARDCATWLKEIDALIPTVRVVVRAPDGSEVGDARLSIDGQTVPVKPNESIAVEPGLRVFRFTRRGSVDTEVRVEVYAGERDHSVDVTLPAASPPSSSAPSSSPDRITPPVGSSASSSGERVGSLVAGGIGAVALLAAGALAINGHLDRVSMESSCAPRCAEDDVAGIRTLWTASAVTAGVGLIALGVAIFLWPKRPTRDVQAAFAPAWAPR
jgi:hypothetical protein